MNDEFYMQRAIELAKRGEGFVRQILLSEQLLSRTAKSSVKAGTKDAVNFTPKETPLKTVKNQLKALQFMSRLNLAVTTEERLLAQKQLSRQKSVELLSVLVTPIRLFLARVRKFCVKLELKLLKTLCVMNVINSIRFSLDI